MEQQNNLRSKYLADGYIVLKSVFTKEYISNIRQKMINLSTKDMLKFEILSDKDIQKIILNEELISCIKKILNTENLLYYSDSSIVNHQDPFKNRNGFHIDARGEDQNISYE